MAEEQQILATAFLPLVNALTNPLPTWTLSTVENVRVSTVTTDMGLQYAGNVYEGNLPKSPVVTNIPRGITASRGTLR